MAHGQPTDKNLNFDAILCHNMQFHDKQLCQMGQVKVNNKGKLQFKNCTIFDGTTY
jgi:hypothetical protein